MTVLHRTACGLQAEQDTTKLRNKFHLFLSNPSIFHFFHLTHDVLTARYHRKYLRSSDETSGIIAHTRLNVA